MVEQSATEGASPSTATPQTPEDSARRASVESVATSTGTGGASRRSLKTEGRRNSMRRRSSDFFAAARASFVRSRGQTGATAETLRGNTGADFEGYATVHRGDGDGAFAMFDISNLLCCGRKKDGLFYLLIKGYHCFVFKDEDAKSPKYAVELMNCRAVVQPSHSSLVPHIPHPGASQNTTYTTIHLETGLGDVEYKFTFANMDDQLAAKFCNAVAVASNEATTEQTRKRLGHEGLLSKRSSVRYANAVGSEKAKEQPEAPVGAGEVMAGMTAVGY